MVNKMANSKMTRVEALEMAIANVTNTEAIEVLTKIKASIEKKNASPKSKKATEAQTFIRNEIVRILGESATPLTVGEILELVDRANAPKDTKFSTSSITSNIGVMLINGKTPNPDGIILRSVDGKSAKFTLAEAEAETSAEDDFEDEADVDLEEEA